MNAADQSKRIVASFLNALSCGDYEVAFDLLDGSAEWIVMGEGPGAGRYDKRLMKASLVDAREMFRTPITWIEISMTAEDGRVGVELRGAAVTNCGYHYENRYFNFFFLSGGRIREVRELSEQAPVEELYATLGCGVRR